ncbi:MAG: hypothetical protein HY904_04225 [Deltaproteobacteria bacterium]|nr:hypothetical protein [Deltaproteobacteria bacterium]
MADTQTPQAMTPSPPGVAPASLPTLVAVMLVLPAIAYAVGIFALPRPTSVATTRTTIDRARLEGEVLMKQTPTPKLPANGNFGGKITVLGVDVAETVAGVGTRVNLTFYYRCDGEMQENWKVFLHVDSQGGRYRIHGDHFPPTSYSTDRWRKGDIVADRYTLWVPLDAQKGPYDIWMGFYDPAHEDDRLPLTAAENVPTDGQNRLKLGVLTVN